MPLSNKIIITWNRLCSPGALLELDQEIWLGRAGPSLLKRFGNYSLPNRPRRNYLRVFLWHNNMFSDLGPCQFWLTCPTTNENIPSNSFPLQTSTTSDNTNTRTRTSIWVPQGVTYKEQHATWWSSQPSRSLLCSWSYPWSVQIETPWVQGVFCQKQHQRPCLQPFGQLCQTFCQWKT